jgi:glycolate oxidase FAD binding subunit
MLDDLPVAEAPGLPHAGRRVAPGTLDEAARLLDEASEDGASILVWGGGTHQGYGHRLTPDIVLSTENLDEIVAYEPADMTAVVQAGVTVADLEALTGEHNQTALLTERPGPGTVGGLVAAGISGWRRYRFGPTRDRMLEATLVTGDGRIVTGGGRVVKNVTGYDLPRLVTGSFGSLGLIGQVCLKLWPRSVAFGTVMVDSAEAAIDAAFRPLAVLETADGAWCYLGGTAEEVAGQAAALDGELADDLEWPEPVVGDLVVSIRVPPSALREMIGRFDREWDYIGQFGVGEVSVAIPDSAVDALDELRSSAESAGGSLVLVEAPAALYEVFGPWGTPPSTLNIQRRLIARFDPARILNPGRLPGGL